MNRFFKQISLAHKLAFILFLISNTAEVNAQSGNPGNILVHTINPGPDNPRNSEGAFIELKDSRILYVYSRFSGSKGSDHAPAQLVGRYSVDGGLTWTKEDQVIVDKEGEMNVMSVSLLRLQNNSIALFYAQKNSLDDCMPQMRISKDEGRSWSEPLSVIPENKKGYFVVNNDRVVQLRSGRILIPVSLHKTSLTAWSNKGSLQCYLSDDQGFSWQAGNVVPGPDSIITQEPGIVELKNGIIMMFIRASGGEQYKSYSTDNGLNWSFALPSGIKSPISPASIKKIPASKKLLLVWNNNGAKGPGYFKSQRSPLTIAVSQNYGKTWRSIKNLEDDPNGMFCYTAIHFTGNHVLLGYGVGQGLSSSYIRRLSLDWIYQKK